MSGHRGLAVSIAGLALLAACGGGTKATSLPTPTTPTPTGSTSASPTPIPTSETIQVIDNDYVPKTLTITAGTAVVWIEIGVSQHTVTAADGSFDSHPDCPADINKCMKHDDTFVQTFDKPGHIAYFCKLHKEAGMTGEIVVV